MKIYLTLNDEKEKDKLIIDYLNAQYSKTGTIKDMLYQKATNAGNMPVVASGVVNSNNQQEAPKGSNEVTNANMAKNSKKVNISEFIL